MWAYEFNGKPETREYWLRDSHTQDTVRVPKETAEAIMPQLQHYKRFGQDRWFRPTLEKYLKTWEAIK